MKPLLVLCTTCLLLLALPVYSLDLQTAKDQGLVGETPGGYLEAVNSPSADVRALIDSINSQRREKYQEIAARNNTSLQAVELLAGEKAIEKSGPGSYIKIGDSWQQK
jgi:uncharacterized protein YdbL (DUF1318 family)